MPTLSEVAGSSRRRFLTSGCIALGGLGLAFLTPGVLQGQVAGAAAGRAPNIIFVLGDDVGLTEIACCGGDRYRTPNIDALARTGTRFEYCYSTPLSGPSRCELLTGRYPFRTGLNTNQSEDAVSPSREVMMPTVMKTAGYATALVGKWGQICLGPGEWGFDEYLTFSGNGHYWASQQGGQGGAYTVNGKAKSLGTTEYLPDTMHSFLVDFVKRHKDAPFYIQYSLSNIHGPFLRTPDTKPGEKSQAVFYADNVAYMDKLVGQLVAELDGMGLRENTLIVFAGDNGTAKFGADRGTVGGRRIFGQKGQLNQGGCRVPLIVNWIGTTPAGVVNHDLTDLSDFFSTFAELAGARLPRGVTIDGQSFAAQIKGQKGTPRQWVYAELAGESFVCDARYKLSSGGDLFDLRDAPFDEIAIAKDSKDVATAVARARLQAVLDQHPAAPAPQPRRRRQGAAATQ